MAVIFGTRRSGGAAIYGEMLGVASLTFSVTGIGTPSTLASGVAAAAFESVFSVVGTGTPSALASGIATASFSYPTSFTVTGIGTPSTLASGVALISFSVPSNFTPSRFRTFVATPDGGLKQKSK